MQIPTIMSEDFTTFRMSMIQKDTLKKGGGERVGRWDALCIVGENVN